MRRLAPQSGPARPFVPFLVIQRAALGLAASRRPRFVLWPWRRFLVWRRDGVAVRLARLPRLAPLAGYQFKRLVEFTSPSVPDHFNDIALGMLAAAPADEKTFCGGDDKAVSTAAMRTRPAPFAASMLKLRAESLGRHHYIDGARFLDS